jgi:hypothetical protein
LPHVIQDQLSACTSLFVEDQLVAHFKDLVDFVKKAEQQQKRAAVADGQQLPGEQQWLNVCRIPGPGAVAAGITRWWALSEEM